MTTSDDTIPQKRCTKCGELFPATLEYFHKKKRGLYGIESWCKSCHSKLTLSKAKQWQKDNPTKAKARNDAYYLAHKQEMLDRRRSSYYANIERERARALQWCKANPQIARMRVERRRARKRNLPDNFTLADWHRALEYFNGCCAYCGNQQDFWHVIEADHFIPLSSPACTGTVPLNMIPACKACNVSKRAFDPLDWLVEKFGKRKTAQIMKRIQGYFDWLKHD